MSKELLYHVIQDYATLKSAKEPVLLGRLREETRGLVGSEMLSSVLQGRVLSFLSKLLQPARVLEIGTYTGYSMLCLAEGLRQGGVLYTLEKNDEVVKIARRYAREASRDKDVVFLVGDALEMLSGVEGLFDLVFIDADKGRYSQYYELVVPKVRSGGLIIADNVFWGGSVMDDEQVREDRRTRALAEFTTRLQEDSRVEALCLPVRDGLLIGRKL